MRRSLRSSATLPTTVLSAIAFAACGDAPVVGPEAPPEIALDAVAANAAQPGTEDWIVVFKPGLADPPGLARRLVSENGGTLRHIYQYTIEGFGATLPSQALNGIRNNPNVAYVEADGVATIDGDQPNPSSWGLDRIDESDLPLDSNYHYDFDGTDVDVYIIDTGIRTSHNEFGGRASPGFDYDGSPDGNDCNGHGTHVGGTVGGATFGVAKDVNLFAVRVLSCSGSGTWIDVIAGVDWVTQQHQLANQSGTQPSVANMSLSGGGNTSLDNAVAASIAAGVTYAVSAANYNTSACGYSPARLPAAITVGSTTSSDARSSFSNYGSCVDIFAPGSSILSAGNSSDGATSTKSGTSMSSPHVAGAAALLLEEDPSRGPAQVAGLLDSRATQNVISNVGSGSPNQLLCSLAVCPADGGGGGGGGDPTQVEVTSVPVPTLSGRKHKAGTANIVVAEVGGGSPSGVNVTVEWFKNDETTPSKTTTEVTTNGVATVTSGSIKGASSIAVCVTGLSGTGFDDQTVYPACSSNHGSGGGGGGGGTPAIHTARLTQNGKGPFKANLGWTGGEAAVDVYYNGTLQAGSVSNTGSYTHNLGKNPQGTHSYQVCNTGADPAECSDEVEATP
jgi:subtilisin family serine protease